MNPPKQPSVASPQEGRHQRPGNAGSAVAPRLTHARAVLLMVAVTLMWSTAGVVTRQLEHARSFEITFWRSFFTMLSLLVILPAWQGARVFRQMHWKSPYF